MGQAFITELLVFCAQDLRKTVLKIGCRVMLKKKSQPVFFVVKMPPCQPVRRHIACGCLGREVSVWLRLRAKIFTVLEIWL